MRFEDRLVHAALVASLMPHGRVDATRQVCAGERGAFRAAALRVAARTHTRVVIEHDANTASATFSRGEEPDD